jgi:Leucine-rich repeat (LRR) protein
MAMLRFAALLVLSCAPSAAAGTFCGTPIDESTLRIECKDKSVTDLTPLTKATKLAKLDIRLTHVKNLAPLAKLTALRSLDIRGTQVTDLKPLAGLELSELHASSTAITDLAPLADMSSLIELDLSDTPVANIKPLGKLTALDQIDLRITKVSKTDAQWLGTIAKHVYWGADGEGHFGTAVPH